MDFEATDTVTTCISCNAAIATDSRFCKSCGSLQVESNPEETTHKMSSLMQVGVFYALQLGICCLFTFTKSLQTFTCMLIADGGLAAIAVAFFVAGWHNNRYLLRWNNFSFSKLCLYCAVAFSFALLVHYAITWLNVKLFSRHLYYYLFFRENGHGAVWMIFSIAVYPALFEELAYRGYVLEKLGTITDVRQAIFITSLLFAVIHLSFLSLFWLIPFSLFLAHVRAKEQTLWYGSAIHFCFNLTVCLLELIN
ncbi:CPBP family intramembrane glutamic endopeptidase [Mucilaginibacter yixingensis]|nr:CPBP family intramembrane glutamic endopeptidase [Mucilaginibacter yixingensis]